MVTQALDFPQFYLLQCLFSKPLQILIVSELWCKFGTILFSVLFLQRETFACTPEASWSGHNVVLCRAHTLRFLFRESKAAASRQKPSDPTLPDNDEDMLFCD